MGSSKAVGFGEAVAAWIRASMRDPRTGRDKMTRTELIRRSKIARATLYRLLSGESPVVEQETIDAIAVALKVPPPQVHVTFRGAGLPAELPTPTPLGLLREARALIAQAERMMGDEPGATGLPPAQVGEAVRRARVLERDLPSSGATRGHSRPA